jgi:stringent starvation protein B
MGEGQITGGKTTGNGGGILNNGVLTLYGGEITGNVAALGGGVYNNGGEQGFWMTGGLIKGNTATTSNPAIGGEVIFNAQAAVQIDADGTQVTIAQALANMASYNYVKPVMPSYDEIENDYTLLTELYNALGNDVWTGYGAQTGVISYKHGSTQNSFNASFMGGTYSFDLPFEAFTAVSKTDNGDGTFTYNLTVNLPAETGLAQETLHVTMNSNGEITELESENAGIEMQKEEGPVTGWAALQAAMNHGGVIKLGENVTAESTDLALTVPAGKTVVLELNGFNINRALTSAVENGSVIVNNGTLAIMGEGQITGGNTTGNGGGILNKGTLTLYGGEITGNHAHVGAGVYNNKVNTATEGFWMTGGLIHNNTADTYSAIKGDVTFNNMAVVQINAQGTTISIATAIANMASLNYVKPVMPDMTKFALLTELYNALGTDVWTGYGATTGVISYSQGSVPNTFNATFMGGTYSLDIPFADFASVEKVDNGDGTFTYNLVVNLPAQTGMAQETLHVTMNSNGEITELESENAGIEMQKEEGPVTGWAALQAAMTNGGVIKLAADVTAESTDAALVVPNGKTVVLELNGHIINRALTSAVADGSVIVNNGTLAIMGEGQITGGKTTGNGGGILNNGVLTLYGGEITGNVAALGGGVYNNGGEQGFWMTGGLIKGNTATTSNPAIGGNVIFNDLAVVQVNVQGTKVSIANALANMATYDYIQPAMPDMEDMTKNTLLLELYNALGNDVWTGYGAATGVISYKQGTEPNSFNASFMGGTYSFDLPFEAFEAVSKADNGDGTFTYTLTVNLPAQTGLSQETLHVTMNNQGQITELESENVEIDMNKEQAPVTGWAALQAAMTNGGVIKLGENVTAASTDAALTVPEGKTVVLELNGFNINRALTSAVENGSVIVNNGTLAIMGEGQITGGKTTGNGGGILNNGVLTLYGGEITGNVAALGGGVYSETNAQFWMTGGLIHGNTATSNPAIGGDVIFNDMAAVQIDADGTQVTIEQALANIATYSYIKPVMPNYEDIPTGATIVANNDPQNDGTYYSTFYDSANNYILPEGVAAYVADLSGSDLVLTRIAMAGQVIPADNAVILVSSMANYSITKTNAVPVTFTANNDLEGVDEATPLTDIPGLTAQNCYVLSGTAQYGVGFYRINVGTLKAHKAFVQYTGNQNNAPKRMRFVFNQEQTATGMEDVQGSVQTTKILRNDQIIIIRNGVEYTINGQKVK